MTESSIEITNTTADAGLLTRPELLIPASSLEVLKTAVRFGADAVYIGGEAFGLRAKAKNFSPEDMAEGIRFAHDHGVKVHVTVNILAHNADLAGAEQYLKELALLKPDALIIADPGIFMMARRLCPDCELHVSTQANNTNYETFRFWHDLGAARVVCARELSLYEIAEIRRRVPEDLAVEAFVHGAMCISYSGRCLLSNYFTGRDANHGACTHPCRWEYAVAEKSRPGQYLPIEENERGTFIFNSCDLCMIEHIPELIGAGINSFKIEGRMKNALYVATVTRTYRRAIDDYLRDPELYRTNVPSYVEAIKRCTYRPFSTGFYFGKPDEGAIVYDNNLYEGDAVYLGIFSDVREMFSEGMQAGGLLPGTAEINVPELTADEKAAVQSGAMIPVSALFEQRNKFCVGDSLDVMRPDGTDVRCRVISLETPDGEFQSSAAHPKQILRVTLLVPADAPLPENGDLIRLPRE